MNSQQIVLGKVSRFDLISMDLLVSGLEVEWPEIAWSKVWKLYHRNEWIFPGEEMRALPGYTPTPWD